MTLLSHANLFLSAHALASEQTSGRYSNVISMFYRFLSTQPKFANVRVGDYHVVADNRDIKRWQVARQIDRVKQQKTSPSSKTIFEDAQIILFFFNWICDAGYPTSVNVKKKTWYPNFKLSRMLNYVRDVAHVSVDSKNIDVLDRERRQHNVVSLITNSEIKALIESYTDPVYSTIFKLGLGTAMRPMDLCKFPYIGNGMNRHIMPYSSMEKRESRVVNYSVELSKGKKGRIIKINTADLKMLEDDYIRPYYAERAKKYERLFGKKCPPSILFLNKQGLPVTPSKISSRTNDAKKIAMMNCPGFREKVSFYDARHWWPTMFLIQFFKDRLLTDSADALYLAVAEELRNQMGHEDLSTTYKYYVDMGRLVMLAHEGSVHELVTEPAETVQEFVDRFSHAEEP
ncbi:hypothetical protein ACWV27_12890 [Massilia varians]